MNILLYYRTSIYCNWDIKHGNPSNSRVKRNAVYVYIHTYTVVLYNILIQQRNGLHFLRANEQVLLVTMLLLLCDDTNLIVILDATTFHYMLLLSLLLYYVVNFNIKKKRKKEKKILPFWISVWREKTWPSALEFHIYYSIIFAHHSSVVFYRYIYFHVIIIKFMKVYRYRLRLYIRIIIQQQRCYQLKIKANKHLVVLLVRIFCSAKETRLLKMSDAIHQSVKKTDDDDDDGESWWRMAPMIHREHH